MESHKEAEESSSESSASSSSAKSSSSSERRRRSRSRSRRRHGTTDRPGRFPPPVFLCHFWHVGMSKTTETLKHGCGKVGSRVTLIARGSRVTQSTQELQICRFHSRHAQGAQGAEGEGKGPARKAGEARKATAAPEFHQGGPAGLPVQDPAEPLCPAPPLSFAFF